MVQEKVKVAVVGLGPFGLNHVEAFQANPKCELVAVVTRNVEQARSVATQYGIPNAYGSVEDLLANEQLDGVSIVTAGEVHKEQTLQVLAAHVPVLLEKPITLNYDDALKILEAEKNSDAFVMPAHVLRFSRSYRMVKKRLDSGAIGKPLSFTFKRYRTQEHDRWFPTIHPVLVTTVHDIDLAIWLSGDTPQGYYFSQTPVAHTNHSQAFLGHVTTALGQSWLFQGSWAVPDGTHIPDSLEVIGTEGVLSFVLQDPVTEYSGSGVSSPDSDLMHSDRGALVTEIDYFIDCLLQGSRPTAVTLEEAVLGISIAEKFLSLST